MKTVKKILKKVAKPAAKKVIKKMAKKTTAKQPSAPSKISLPAVGTAAPAFKALDQHGDAHTLSEYKGSWVLMYFYPKDDTPGCTKEACLLRDGFPFFEGLKAVVLGVSVDSVKSHHKFVEKYQLPFTLLADEDKKMVTAYGVWGDKKFMGRTYTGTKRVSFLIDPKGKIAKVYPDVNPAKHADEVMADLKGFTK
jgi:peroxiredoxin Q/BCP